MFEFTNVSDQPRSFFSCFSIWATRPYQLPQRRRRALFVERRPSDRQAPSGAAYSEAAHPRRAAATRYPLRLLGGQAGLKARNVIARGEAQRAKPRDEGSHDHES